MQFFKISKDVQKSRLGVAIDSQDFVTQVSNLLTPGHGRSISPALTLHASPLRRFAGPRHLGLPGLGLA